MLENKISNLKNVAKFGEDFLAKLCQKYQEATTLIGGLDAWLKTLTGKHTDAQIENEKLIGEVDSLKDKKLALEEKFKALREIHKVELENQHCSHDETSRKYQEDTQKNLIEVLPE